MVAFIALFAGLVAVITPVAALRRGLAWATNNNYADHIANNPLIRWYHRESALFEQLCFCLITRFSDWQNGPVPQMPSHVEYVPMFWGTEYWGLWEERVKEMEKKTPAHLMFLNEPDVSSQANIDPYSAATLFMEQIYPWHKKGTLLGGPAMIWNLDWLATFLEQIEKKGGSVHSVCLHWSVICDTKSNG
jgi:hypothetical protein